MAELLSLNLIALTMSKTLWSFGHSECNRVKVPFAFKDPINCSEGKELNKYYCFCSDPYIFSSPGRSPGRAIVLPLASALALALALAKSLTLKLFM